MSRAVVLLARGIFADRQSGELERAVSVVQVSGRYECVAGAYVDHGTPDLPTALDACAEAGATHILVAPIFTPIDRFLSTWIPQVIRRWLRRRPQYKGIEVILAQAPGLSDALGHAALEALQAAERDGGSDPIREDLGLDYANPGFNVIPPYRYQALVCTGPRCATRGSVELYEHVHARIAAGRLTGRTATNGAAAAPGAASATAAAQVTTADAGPPTGPERISVIRTGCLFPCNLGPVMVVHPAGTWYCSLTPSMVDRIVDEHFLHGRVVEVYTRVPGRDRHTRPTPAAPADIVEDAVEEPVAHTPTAPAPREKEGAPVP